MQAIRTVLGEGGNAIVPSQSTSVEGSVSSRLGVCIRTAAVECTFPVVIVAAALISTETFIALVSRR
jgi:hypothetical protein